MSMFTKTRNYVLAEYDGGHFIKILSQGVWRDCVGTPELADADLAKMLEEELQREEAAEWVVKAGRANPDLGKKLMVLTLNEELEAALKADEKERAEKLKAKLEALEEG